MRFRLIVAALGLLAVYAMPAHAQDPYARRTIYEIDPDTVQARRFDDGRMWTFNSPPLGYLEARYSIEPSQDWLTHARMGALRIPGCTASFVSAHGLMLTNHHCGRSHAAAVARPDERILRDGFYAERLSAERRVPGLYADQLVAVNDVTATVQAALDSAETDAERAAAREAVFARLSARFTENVGAGDEDYRTEITALYDGGRYVAHTYRRYTDVRLVFIPELDVGYFGGDTDNFTYPRYTLDMSLFRVYNEAGEPVEPTHFFPWSRQGARPGDPVFVVGNPGSTLRLETYEQLLFRRDVQDVGLLRFLQSRIAAIQAYQSAAADTSADVQNKLFGLQNARKLYNGRVEALRDAYYMTRIQRKDEAFQRAIRADSSLQARFGGLFQRMAAIQQEKRSYAASYRAFLALTSSYASATLRRALFAYQMERGGGAGSAQRERLMQQFRRVAAQPAELDRELLAARLHDVVEAFGAQDSLVQTILDGRTPQAAARAIVARSAWGDSASAAAALQGPLPAQDPALALVEAMYPRYQAFRSAWAGLQARQREVARQLGRARYAVYGDNVPPDATFTLRLSDGVVQGYPYNGTAAPPFTTYYGMLSHHHAFAGEAWDLPPRWKAPPASFNPETPLNLVSTNDITGGNSGSPLLNANLELVGLVFDGNIESLAGDFIFLPGQMRTIAVDVRGMLEALSAIYSADRITHEVTGQAFYRSEAAVPTPPTVSAP
ncbi:S46 family peptidase [Salisaeta longa]|uniref:S46 family peptidase n=1 Tax=Salisaeta longa TaxID=503170 RepID=UPI0003B3E420|nr:S46 family peptidase [Salisaeta longa]